MFLQSMRGPLEIFRALADAGKSQFRTTLANAVTQTALGIDLPTLLRFKCPAPAIKSWDHTPWFSGTAISLSFGVEGA
jgi:hypothetical protein